jgi:hypothetical protein
MIFPADPGATLLFRNGAAHPAVMMRKSVLKRHQLWYEHPYLYAQDYDLWCRCAVRGIQIANLPEVLLKYRLHEQQITQAFGEATHREGSAIRRQLLRDLELGASDEEISLHNALARDQLVASEAFVVEAARWLTFLGRTEKLAGFCERDALMRVLTGRFVSVCRFAREKGLAVPAVEKSIFGPWVLPGAL